MYQLEYLIFANNVYYPSGGVDDQIGATETVEQAREKVKEWLVGVDYNGCKSMGFSKRKIRRVDKMTPTEINEAIMMSLGYVKRIYRRVPSKVIDERYQPHDGAVTWLTKDGSYLQRMPNYPFDLNDCAEFEQSLSREANVRNRTEAGEYADKLGDVLCLGNGWMVTEFDKIAATAAHRCEAYLRLKGLWCD